MKTDDETIEFKNAILEKLILDELIRNVKGEDIEMINLLTKLLELLRK